MSNNYFTCICGKEFCSSKSLSAHQSSCKEYYLFRDGNLDKYYLRKENLRIANKKTGKILSERAKEVAKIKKESALDLWISEQHVCEKCGKVMTKKFGSGRFCSMSCANSHQHSNETKEKISQFAKENPLGFISDKYKRRIKYKDNELYLDLKQRAIVKLLNIINYYLINGPSKCSICKTPLNYKQRNNRACSDDCRRIVYHNNAIKNNIGGYIRFSGTNKQNKGYYKGYYCDSTWELAYVIYNLEHNIKFDRCKRKYKYIYKDKVHYYHPDFELEDGTVIEIKGYRWVDDKLEYKIKSVTDRKLIILYKENLKEVFDYVISKYGKDYRKLYDKDTSLAQ